MGDHEDVTSPLASMLGMIEVFMPIMETAKGFKAKMEAEGWSPTVAEDVAREFMVGAMFMAMRGNR